MTINQLLQARNEAAEAHNAERDRLAALGLKSAQRYELLKPLKAKVDELHNEYTKKALRRAHATATQIINENAARG